MARFVKSPRHPGRAAMTANAKRRSARRADSASRRRWEPVARPEQGTGPPEQGTAQALAGRSRGFHAGGAGTSRRSCPGTAGTPGRRRQEPWPGCVSKAHRRARRRRPPGSCAAAARRRRPSRTSTGTRARRWPPSRSTSSAGRCRAWSKTPATRGRLSAGRFACEDRGSRKAFLAQFRGRGLRGAEPVASGGPRKAIRRPSTRPPGNAAARASCATPSTTSRARPMTAARGNRAGSEAATTSTRRAPARRLGRVHTNAPHRR